MTNWTDIHEGFGEYGYQQLWEQTNITKEEAKEWIELGFRPNFIDLDKVKQWKNFNFSAAEVKSWLEVGLDKGNYYRHGDWEFASWLRTKHYTPELVKNSLKQLRNDYKNFQINNSQVWLEQFYPNHNIKRLDIRDKNLKGELNFSQYQQLELLYCSRNKLTNITLPLIPYGIRNQDFASSLKYLDLSNNNFNQDLSFLVPYTNLEKLDLSGNKFTGSLDCLSGMEQLKELGISNTDINEVQIDKLPRSLKKIEYSTNERPDCKLTAIVSLLEPINKYGWCDKCKEPNTSKNWCQPCAEQEWEQLSGQELINNFIKEQQLKLGKDRGGKDRLKWIPYEEFTNIEHLADGGFSKIYKAKWGIYYNVVLKFLNNSQNITLEFLTEIANTKMVEGYFGSNIVECHGVSQDPTTKNYLMVMKYMEKGNLREYLQNKDNKLSLKGKLDKLRDIALGLNNIHNQNLVHQDFHSGNILNGGIFDSSYITDLGLSRPINHPKQTGQIFGVLPYVAPEVLLGKPYTKAADIYSFGIIAYEFLVNSYPYPEMDDTELSLAVCNGHRPNLDKIPLPQLLKDLIKSCWDSNPDKRPKAEELWKITKSWTEEIYYKQNTPFYQQHLEIEAEYNIFCINTPYQIHANAITTSKMIDTKQITEQLKTMEYSKSLLMDFGKLNLGNNQDWTNIHLSFTNELIQQWKEQNFTFEQTRDWINVGFQPTDANFCAWLRDIKQVNEEWVLNYGNSEQLNQEYFQWWQEQQLQTNIEQPPK